MKYIEKSKDLQKKGEKIMTKRFGFTLAEVLITLGIIGVVAAMTMPTLMNSTQGAQYKSAYKKALSALGQAVTLNVALDDYNFADTSATGLNDDYSIGKIINTRMNVVKTEDGKGLGYPVNEGPTGYTATDANYSFFFNDGVVFSMPKDSKGCIQGDATTPDNICHGLIDVNGQKGPNKVVKCDGKTDYKATDAACKVSNPTDIYPVVFYNQTVLPSTDAARAVLYGK